MLKYFIQQIPKDAENGDTLILRYFTILWETHRKEGLYVLHRHSYVVGEELKQSRTSLFFEGTTRYKGFDYKKLRETATHISDGSMYAHEQEEFSSLACELRAQLFNWDDGIMSYAEREFRRDFNLDESWIRKTEFQLGRCLKICLHDPNEGQHRIVELETIGLKFGSNPVEKAFVAELIATP